MSCLAKTDKLMSITVILCRTKLMSDMSTAKRILASSKSRLVSCGPIRTRPEDRLSNHCRAHVVLLNIFRLE